MFVSRVHLRSKRRIREKKKENILRLSAVIRGKKKTDSYTDTNEINVQFYFVSKEKFLEQCKAVS